MLHFIDFEVFKHDWMCVIISPETKSQISIINNPKELELFYNNHKKDIFVGFNIRNYDQYIFKAILLGFDPKAVNDHIIVKGRKGWQYSSLFQKVDLLYYDVMPNPPKGLKTMEAFMGADVRETEVDFDLDRGLTEEEINLTLKYCTHDVEQTIQVFLRTQDRFKSVMTLIKQFKLPIECIGMTEAQITARILECRKTNRDDEFDFVIEPYQEINKYTDVLNWFKQRQGANPTDIKKFYKESLEINVAGVPHKFGWGGIHGAKECYQFRSGKGRQCWHVDVTSYYPSYLIAHDKITRSAEKPDRYSWAYFYQIDLKKQGRKSERMPYKLLLNALSGAMKDQYNPAYDPCMNNTMVINCQLSALMLIEMLEQIKGFELVQSNTDGLIITIPDTDEAFEQLDDLCYEWEKRCSTDKAKIALEFDDIEWLIQKDVNNYIFQFPNGKVERKGAWLKELNELDNDLPILNKAVVDYFVKGVPVEKTINDCNDLMQFQKVVKLSDLFQWVEHNGIQYTNKCYRVFASKDPTDTEIKNCRLKDGKTEKKRFGYTADRVFIYNDDVHNVLPPAKIDRQWYIDEAKKRIGAFNE